MAPQGRNWRSSRNKPAFNIKEILLYGIPVWIGAPALGWYFKGWLGIKSAVVGLVVLAAYLAAEIIVANKSRKMPGDRAIVLMLAGFWIRLVALFIVTYTLYRLSEFDLFVLLLTVVFGFTATLFISVKNWL